MSKANNLSGLAINGGTPIRKTWLPYSRQVVDDSDKKEVLKVLDSDFLTRGPAVVGFENAVKDLVEMPEAVAFSSATAALHAVMAMLGVNPEKKVVTSPITFAATSNSVLYCHGTVSFCDIEESTMNIDVEQLKKMKDFDIAVAVDFAGNPCRYDELFELQRKKNFRLVADAAHSFGGTYKGKPVGSICDINVLSFHPVKSMTTGEGGMVLVRDKKEAEFLRHFRSHGIVRTETPGYYRQEFLGFNYNITDLQCALGLSQLKKLARFVRDREAIAKIYAEKLKGLEMLRLPITTDGAQSAWHLYPVRLDLKRLSCSRTEFLSALHAENIGANVHYIPVYLHPFYEKLGFKKGLCPRSEQAYEAEISLPVFPTMTETDISDVCQGLEKLLSAYLITT